MTTADALLGATITPVEVASTATPYGTLSVSPEERRREVERVVVLVMVDVVVVPDILNPP